MSAKPAIPAKAMLTTMPKPLIWARPPCLFCSTETSRVDIRLGGGVAPDSGGRYNPLTRRCDSRVTLSFRTNRPLRNRNPDALWSRPIHAGLVGHPRNSDIFEAA